MPLNDFFDRIAVISLPGNEDRRRRLHRQLQQFGVSSGIVWVEAVDGRGETLPEGWTAGHGGYGCLLSHCAVIEDAASSGVERLLVLEDDVIFSPHLTEWLPRFMNAVPEDWDQIYLGGQHLCYPHPTAHPLVWHPRDVNRTHAYAVQSHAFERVLSHIGDMHEYVTRRGWHVDWQLGRAHARLMWSTWCPPWWLAGQGECISTVAEGASCQDRWWQPREYALSLPVLVIPCRGESIPADQRNHLLLPSDPWLPEDIREAYFERLDNDALLAAWLREFAGFALDFWRLPAVSSIDIDQDRLARLWPAAAIHYHGQDLAGLCDYPFNGLFEHPMNSSAGLATTITHPPITYTHDQSGLLYHAWQTGCAPQHGWQ